MKKPKTVTTKVTEAEQALLTELRSSSFSYSRVFDALDEGYESMIKGIEDVCKGHLARYTNQCMEEAKSILVLINLLESIQDDN